MTPEDIAKARALCEAATVPPWKADKKERIGENWMIGSIIDTGSAEDGNCYSNWIVTTDCVHASEMISGDAKADAEFIAAARTLLPEALDEIERLRKQLSVTEPNLQASCSDYAAMFRRVHGEQPDLPQPVRTYD
jgi:hypothetical protein